MNNKLKVLSLFSGIGAYEKALKRQNIDFELVKYCEVDKVKSKAYSILHNVSENKIHDSTSGYNSLIIFFTLFSKFTILSNSSVFDNSARTDNL